MGLYINFDFPNIPRPKFTYWNMPLFTDNAKVYYKPHSLSQGGVGTVRNYRKKSKKT
jgi:hypothetical protein